MKITAAGIQANPNNDIAIKNANDEIRDAIIRYSTSEVITHFRISEEFDPGTLLIHLGGQKKELFTALRSQYPAVLNEDGPGWQTPEGWNPLRYSVLICMLYTFGYDRDDRYDHDKMGSPFGKVTFP